MIVINTVLLGFLVFVEKHMMKVKTAFVLVYYSAKEWNHTDCFPSFSRLPIDKFLSLLKASEKIKKPFVEWINAEFSRLGPEKFSITYPNGKSIKESLS